MFDAIKYAKQQTQANEKFAGLYMDWQLGKLVAFYLLDGDNDDEPWQEQLDWAKSIGGDLPNRIELAMLFADFKHEFQEDWYWSNTTHHTADGWAWCQSFYYGDQDNDRKDDSNRARAVRRLVIGEQK